MVKRFTCLIGGALAVLAALPTLTVSAQTGARKPLAELQAELRKMSPAD